MKKILSLLLLLVYTSWYLTTSVFAASNVLVYAIVGNINTAPMIISISNNWNPEAIENGASQTFAVVIQDAENDTITYTATPQDGSASPISWTVSSYDWNNRATINLTYLAPGSTDLTTKITLTLNDGANVVSEDINLYIY